SARTDRARKSWIDMPHFNGSLRQSWRDGTQSCLNADQAPSPVIKSGSVLSRARPQTIFVNRFTWLAAIAWSSPIRVAKKLFSSIGRYVRFDHAGTLDAIP